MAVTLMWAGWYLWRLHTTPPVPVVDVTGIDPAVAAAIDKAHSAVERAPRSAAAWGRFGIVLLANDYPDVARTAFAQAERLDPREARWPFFQGVVLTWKDAVAAVEKLQRAAALDGPEAVRLRLADLLLQLGRDDDAADQYQQVKSRNPQNPRAALGLARVAFDRGDWQVSLDHLAGASASPYTARAARELKAAVRQRLDLPHQAESFSPPAPSPDREWPDPWLADVDEYRVGKKASLKRADQYIMGGRPADAVALLGPLLREYPDCGDGWLKLGGAWVAQHNWAAAEQALGRAVDLMPQSVESHFFLGITLSEQGRMKAAADSFRRALALQPDYALAHYNLGVSLQGAGDAPGAAEALAAAVKCKPNFPEAYLRLGELLIGLQRTDEARAYLSQALQLEPGNAAAQKVLQRLGPDSGHQPEASARPNHTNPKR
jgi:tetratricopeptide (TPR) repeat protein